MDEAFENVWVTKTHFEEAFSRVKESLNKKIREEYDRLSWYFLYNGEQKELLQRVAELLIKATFNGQKDDHYDALNTALCMIVPKNFETIRI